MLRRQKPPTHNKSHSLTRNKGFLLLDVLFAPVLGALPTISCFDIDASGWIHTSVTCYTRRMVLAVMNPVSL